MRKQRKAAPHNKTRWCNHIKNKTEFYIRTIFQWDGVEVTDLDGWLSNFTGDDGQYIAMRLLNRFIYYSEKDVILLLKHGIYKVLLYDESVNWARNTEFLMPITEQERLARKAIKAITFTPLLDRNKPSESGNVLCRHLNQHLDVASEQLCQPNELINLRDKEVVILDDFVGSGQQIIDFWNGLKIGGKRLSNLATSNNLKVTYLCLVATRYGLTRVNKYAQGLKVLSCEILEEDHRVFHSSSLYFGQRKEVQEARRYLSSLCDGRNIRLLGWHNLDYAVAFHHAIPDATLPLFYKNTTKWKRLVKRRES